MKKIRSPKSLFSDRTEENEYEKLAADPDKVLALLRKSRALIDSMNDQTLVHSYSWLPRTEEELRERARKTSHVTRMTTPRGQKADFDFGDALQKTCNSLIENDRDDDGFIFPLFDAGEDEYFYRVKRRDGKLTFEKVEYEIDLGTVDDLRRAQVAVA
jgi:hypothetical protein